ncbi:MAG: DUF309 domain-containing protein [Cyanobacteria bacterium J06614_10]
MPISSANHEPESDKSEPAQSGPDQSEELTPLQKGIDEFNRGEFYACHDTLEAIWMDADSAEKPFYQGILQVAVAFYHLGNLNWRGGAILMGEGINRLRRFEPSYQSVDVEELVDQAVEWLTQVQSCGEEGLAELMANSQQSFPQIKVLPAESALH